MRTRTVLVALAATALLNTLIAALLTAIGFGGDFSLNLIYSQCIGLSICTLTLPIPACLKIGWQRLLALVPALVAGSFGGYWLAGALAAKDDLQQGEHFVPAILLGLFFGSVISTFFYLRERNTGLQSEIQRRDLLRLEAEKREVEAHLNLLQAQIEPHFLFNTLANVSALVATQPPLAQTLLDALIRYLRASLAHTRADGGTLGHEVAMLRAYLEVLRIRMGRRLDFAIAVPDALLARSFPPMLLQPLVENAIMHGLEPLPEGGRIDIVAIAAEGRLRITVRDNGRGFLVSTGGGLGLGNVRARLHALFGDAGKLFLSENEPRGVIATVEIPA